MSLTIKDLSKEIDMTAVRGGANANTSAPYQSNVSTPVFNVVSGGGSVAIHGRAAPQFGQEVLLLEHRLEQLLLGAKVVIQQPLRDACRVRQILDGGAVEALGGEDVERGCQQLRAAVLGLPPAATRLDIH